MEKKAPEPVTMDTFLQQVWKENPVFVTMLGMCPTLAVTSSATNAVAMGLSTMFVLIFSNIFVSALRNFIPKEVRIASYIVIIATFVTMVDYILQGTAPGVYAALGAYIQLIVVNCIILGRAEAYAAKNGVMASAINGAGSGVGFTLALLCLGGVREVLGAGTLFGIHLFGPGFQPWLVMILPPGGFLVLAVWLMLFTWLRQRKARRAAAVEGVPVHG